MIKPIIPIIGGIIIVAIIGVLVIMMNTHPSLVEIVENEDCQELGKWDQRMDEIYGYDVNKAKSELNISNELWSKATNLGMSCAFDAVKNMYGGSSEENKVTSEIKKTPTIRELVISESSEIIQNRDCKQFMEWFNDNEYRVRNTSGMRVDHIMELISYNKYCENPDTILDENGIDKEEKWSSYYKWDSD